MTPAAAPESNTSGNGSQDAPAPRAPPVREFHAEPGESPGRLEPATIAHFEPTPKPPDANKPYVVWTSAPPPEKPDGERGPEE
jgi:hypothetical protein